MHKPLSRRRVATFLGATIGTVGLASLRTTVSIAQAAQYPLDEELFRSPRYLGSEDAPVTMIEYFSLTCPACRLFHFDFLPKLKEEKIDTGLVRLEFRDFPLDRVAARAAIISRCAALEDYHSFIDAYYTVQQQVIRSQDPLEQVDTIARLGGMSQDEINSCTTSEESLRFIVEVMQEAQQNFGVEATPTFVLPNGKVIRGVPNLQDLYGILDELIQEA